MLDESNDMPAAQLKALTGIEQQLAAIHALLQKLVEMKRPIGLRGRRRS